jgi:hypothetical protein
VATPPYRRSRRSWRGHARHGTPGRGCRGRQSILSGAWVPRSPALPITCRLHTRQSDIRGDRTMQSSIRSFTKREGPAL